MFLLSSFHHLFTWLSASRLNIASVVFFFSSYLSVHYSLLQLFPFFHSFFLSFFLSFTHSLHLVLSFLVLSCTLFSRLSSPLSQEAYCFQSFISSHCLFFSPSSRLLFLPFYASLPFLLSFASFSSIHPHSPNKLTAFSHLSLLFCYLFFFIYLLLSCFLSLLFYLKQSSFYLNSIFLSSISSLSPLNLSLSLSLSVCLSVPVRLSLVPPDLLIDKQKKGENLTHLSAYD
ncbi:unnamed protein product [Acanthosepion pharaonis]|uniref:Uncharacterized protein n=1 Tax=Acanthosepion pharaonis TaxID=158019 RepID=A0A812CYX7_ACAPH|nr:unnamed protein product [Sepia pharaonis]